ncbi:hypothetical protein EAE96_010805 [Botrytis aclada]|nr:hypothetical protein EAE96_010805 [Botrytis aclada]
MGYSKSGTNEHVIANLEAITRYSTRIHPHPQPHPYPLIPTTAHTYPSRYISSNNRQIDSPGCGIWMDSIYK